MKPLVCCIAWLACGVGAVHAEPVVYALDPAHTHIQWEVRHFGTSTHAGRLGPARGSVVIDRAAASGSISMEIDTSGVSSGVPALDTVLRGPWFFDVARHPLAWFVSSRLRFDGDRLSGADGELTLRGVSQPLPLKAVRFGCYQPEDGAGEVCGGDFEATLQRSDYGMTYGLPFVGNSVRLVVQVEGRAR